MVGEVSVIVCGVVAVFGVRLEFGGTVRWWRGWFLYILGAIGSTGILATRGLLPFLVGGGEDFGKWGCGGR